MKHTDTSAAPLGKNFSQIKFLTGHGELPLLEIITPWSTAEIYLHGAHVTRFQKQAEPPLLFLSQASRFQAGQPIRGGVPIIFPWFGARVGAGQHGFARNRTWQLKDVATAADGSVSVRLGLPTSSEPPPLLVEYVVTVNEQLTMELLVTNLSATENFTFENCLHTYFSVADISAVSIHGLKGVTYLDKTDHQSRKVENADAIHFSSEVDRTYLDTTDTVEIRDARLGRVIRVAKENSASTVVWNPWTDKARQMADFDDEEFHQMVCVESGNVAANLITLPPGKVSALQVRLSCAPLE